MNRKLKQVGALAIVATLSAVPALAQQGGGGAAAGGGGGGQQATPQNQERFNERATSPGATLTISPATVRAIQQKLNQMGYTAGQVDGVWGQATAQATQDFQKAKGLEPTGNIDLRTLAALGINPSSGVGGSGGGAGSLSSGGGGSSSGMSGGNSGGGGSSGGSNSGGGMSGGGSGGRG